MQVSRLLKIGNPIPVKQRTRSMSMLYRKISYFKLTLQKVYDPYLQRHEERVIRESRIVLPVNEVGDCVEWHYRKSKGDCAAKLQYRIAKTYYGIGKNTIQTWINKQPRCARRTPFFANKAPLRTISARAVNSRHQIDIVDMSSAPCKHNGKTNRYILSVLDVFSRHLWLRALSDKSADTVVLALRSIYDEWSYPKIIQTDQGSEFKGSFKEFCVSHNILLIHSSSHHPQSQGKDERSHQTWKRKIRFDIDEGSDVNWARNLLNYQSLYNHGFHSSIKMTPHECYFGRKRSVHQKAKAASDKASKDMINRHTSKYPPSQYSVGEVVLVRIPKMCSRGVVRGGYSLRKKFCFEGKIVAVDLDNFRYKVKLRHNDASQQSKWYSVRNVTSITRDKEHEKRKQQCNRMCSGTQYVYICTLVQINLTLLGRFFARISHRCRHDNFTGLLTYLS
jgi:transposase InsO family protein